MTQKLYLNFAFSERLLKFCGDSGSSVRMKNHIIVRRKVYSPMTQVPKRLTQKVDHENVLRIMCKFRMYAT